MASSGEPRVVRGAQAPLLRGPDDAVSRLLIDGETGARAFSLAWLRFPPGGKTEPHVRDVEECIYVLRGRTRVTTGAGEFILEAGDALFIPADTEHAHENMGDTDLEQLAIFAPQGPERLFLDFPPATDH